MLLFFYGYHVVNFYSQVGDRFGLSRGLSCRTIHKYIRAISKLVDDFIIWPRGSSETGS